MAKVKSSSAGVLTRMRKNWQIYVILIPSIVWLILFAYYPMAGLSLAFKTYHAKKGIFGSAWCGLENFQRVFRDPSFMKSVWATLEINLVKLIITFPFPVILAIMFNEIRIGKSKKVLQTIFTFPNFLSWVIVASIMRNLLSVDGVLNGVISSLGGTKVNFLGDASIFRPMLYVTEIWKTAGYSAIIYMSAIAGIDMEQYEAAELDGASRWQRITHITIPNILPTIAIMFVLASGSLMSNGFDQIFNLANAATKSAAETLDIYLYRITFQSKADFGYSTAVSLFRSIINVILLLLSNFVSKKLTGSGLIE